MAEVHFNTSAREQRTDIDGLAIGRGAVVADPGGEVANKLKILMGPE